ncbi:Uu.00g044540.m01.CDS01 [Anthostomella pinea]|uniref:Uu.00g044540.m01.CDS01 n=1 Tax=Anthostomella pinea TaxID=933095 RepID=A0AAI8YE84_9PEZI|nr:Uu.00g044540.m01.CDS01 [Anthostomella pinea]
MAPVVILIRHAEGLHSKYRAHDWSIFDPKLTVKGIEQCKVLAAELEPRFPFTREESLIVVSPLARTLQTVQHSLPWLQARGVPVEVRAEWQETTANPCDVGAALSELEADWPDFDFSKVDPVYPEKTGLYGPSEEAIQNRASVVRRWLFERPEKCVVVVTHSGFLRRLVHGPKYQNVEYRAYRFADGLAEGELELKELNKERPLEHEEDLSSKHPRIGA